MKVFQKLDNFLDYAWAQISRGKVDKKSPARHPTFVTSSTDGFPNARTLVLRRSDRENVPTNSRTAYGTIPSPGKVLESPLAYKHAPNQKRFAVLVCDIQSIQLLLLGVKHIRAYYKKTNNWRGEWLSP